MSCVRLCWQAGFGVAGMSVRTYAEYSILISRGSPAGVDKWADCNYQSIFDRAQKAGRVSAETTLQKRLGGVLFYGTVILLAYLAYLIFAPFLVPLAWAAVLVVVSYPLDEWLERRWGPTTAALVSTAGVTFVLIVPAVFVMIAFVRQGVEAVQSVQFNIQTGHLAWLSGLWMRLQDRFPDLGSDDLTTSLHQYAEQAAGFVAGQLATIVRHTAVFLFDLFVTILAMFYLFRDGDSMVERLRQLLPFDLDHRDRMLSDARNLIFASVTSSLVAAGVHGLLGGLAFGVAGIKGPLFWGVMMGFFSFVPVVGSALIWVPASISLALGGHLGRGIPSRSFAGVIVGLVDNFIRPWLISGRAEMGGLVVFISVLGGISVFGLLGVVLGPIIVATAASLLDLYVPGAHAGNKASGSEWEENGCRARVAPLRNPIEGLMPKNSNPKHRRPAAGKTPLALRSAHAFRSKRQRKSSRSTGDMGQERALRALRMGVEMTASGYNLFVCGLSGTSRGGHDRADDRRDAPADRARAGPLLRQQFQECRPAAPADAARAARRMRSRRKWNRGSISCAGAFRRCSKASRSSGRRRGSSSALRVREKELMDDFTRRIAREQFALGRMQVGAVALPEIFPVLDGQMVPIEEIPKMVQDGKLENAAAEELERKYDQFRQEFTVVYRQDAFAFARAGERDELPRTGSGVGAGGWRDRGAEGKISRARRSPNISRKCAITFWTISIRSRSARAKRSSRRRKAAAGPRPERADRDPFRVYGVNVILAHGENEKCPVIFETIPTYANLFGTIHRSYDTRGGWNSDFMDLRGGSLLRADGGFLVMYALDALTETGVWRTLKRTLNHGKLEIQPVDMFFPFSTAALKPEPIDVHVKIILIGDRDMYELLYDFEDDFKKIFKVRVEFDEEMKWSDEVLRQYGGRLRKLSDDEKLLPFDRTAVASILEHGVRIAGRRGKITTRFFDLADLAREASYAARHNGNDSGDRRARAGGARREDRAAQPARNENPGNDRAEPAVHRHDRRARRPGERPERAGNRRLRFRKTGAHHGVGRAGQDRDYQYRARIESERPLPR